MARLLGVSLFIICIAGVALYVWPARPPLGFSGLEFSDVTRAAAARAPLMKTRGALIQSVVDQSPAAEAGIKPGEVVAAIDGVALHSARQASDIIRAKRAGDHVTLTLFDENSGDIHPRSVRVAFAAAPPPPKKKFSVKPPRILAREFFFPPGMAANAAWSRKILRGPTIRPLALGGIGAGACNGLAPDEWELRGHAGDDSMLHLAAKAGFMHAIFRAQDLSGGDAREQILKNLEEDFGAPAVATPAEKLPFGLTLFHYGLDRGAAGFVLYRVEDGRLLAWITAVPAADAAWAEPLAGAVALSMRCPSQGRVQKRPVDIALTSVSARCVSGQCTAADLAGSYLSTLRLGYVHDPEGDTYLVNPKRDFWQNGAEGPGFYHQIGGTNEKLEPGRTN